MGHVSGVTLQALGTNSMSSACADELYIIPKRLLQKVLIGLIVLLVITAIVYCLAGSKTGRRVKVYRLEGHGMRGLRNSRVNQRVL